MRICRSNSVGSVSRDGVRMEGCDIAGIQGERFEKG